MDKKESAGVDVKAVSEGLPKQWQKFIGCCEHLKYGELAKVQIQDGLPVSAEGVKRKSRFT